MNDEMQMIHRRRQIYTAQKLLALVGTVITIFSIFLPFSPLRGKILSLVSICLVLFPFIKSIIKRDFHITILFGFMISYVLVPMNYFWYGYHINFYRECESDITVYKVLQILCFFHAVLLFNVRFAEVENTEKKELKENNKTIYYILIALSFCLITFGSSGKNIFESGSYSETLSVRQHSSFFAYSVITISLAYVFSNTKRKRAITYFLVFYFCIKDLFMGGRVDCVELLFALFFIRLQYTWSRKKLIIAVASGILLFSAWGILRTDTNVGFYNALTATISGIGKESSIIDYQTGNSAEVYYSSIRIIYLIDHDILTAEKRYQSFLYFVLSAAIPYSRLPSLANLSSYLQKTYWSGGGGLGPVFFYAFGSWVGVLFFSLFVGFCLKLFVKKKKSKYIHFYVILLLSTTPRWYAYYPIQIIKFCLVGTILYYLLETFFKPSRHKHFTLSK